MSENLTYLTVEQVAAILHTTRNYVYQLVHKRQLPVYRPFDGKLLFDPQEIDEFIKKSRSATQSELDAQAVNALNGGAK